MKVYEREREREKRSNFQSMVFGAPLLDHQLHLSHFDLPEDVSKEKKAISSFVYHQWICTNRPSILTPTPRVQNSA